ncbi:MAG TPA: alpha/beta fold hydrolase [Steroidobacteraceae bacterium]
MLRTILLVVLGCAVAASAAANEAPPRHRVHLEGRGAPTVILEAGLGDTLESWSGIQSKIADHCVRTMAYTRAGYPGSDPAGGPRDAATIVAELRAELARRGIRPPYVLVGHSLGGLYMQYFARNFPDEVTGLVLVDSTHWNQGLELHPDATGPWSRRRVVHVFMNWIERREFMDAALAGAQVRASPLPRNIPTIVLSSTAAPIGETPVTRAIGARLQDEIAAEFPGARHVRVEGSGHYIHRDRPEVVVAAARELAGCTPAVAKNHRPARASYE